MADQVKKTQLSDAAFDDVEIELSVCIGHVQSSMSELSMLSNEDVLSLGASIDDPVKLYLGKRLIAEGELEESQDGAKDKLSVRVTQILQKGGS